MQRLSVSNIFISTVTSTLTILGKLLIAAENTDLQTHSVWTNCGQQSGHNASTQLCGKVDD